MILFELGETNTVSPNFRAPAQLTAFGLTPTAITEVNGIVTEMVCGDTITFEQLAHDSKYELNCHGIKEEGVIASTPLLDECCCEVKMDACDNLITLDVKGLFRAVYHGNNRENILLIKE